MPGSARLPILIVEDDPLVRDGLSDSVRQLGYEPYVYADGARVLDDPSRPVFPLGLIDVNLPGMSGLALAEALKNEGRIGDVAFMSGRGTMDNLIQAIQIGACDFLRKPFAPSELELLLRRFEMRAVLRRRASQAESKHDSLIENIPIMVFTMNSRLDLEFVNPAVRVMLGFEPGEAVAEGGWLLDRVHPHDRKKVHEALLVGLETKAKFSLECRLLHRRGSIVNTIVRSIPMRNGNAAKGLLEGVVVDITDRVVLERALVQNEKLKTLGAVTAEVAHEIRNPLMTIAGFARRLDRKVPDLPETGILLHEARRLEKLLGRISDYLRPVELGRRECGVNAILADCVGALSPAMDAKGVRCDLSLDQELSAVASDPEVLRQVFDSLLRQANDELEPGGMVAVRTHESDANVFVEFRHAVAGVGGADPENILLPFEQRSHDTRLPDFLRQVRDLGGQITFSRDSDQEVHIVALPKDARLPQAAGSGARNRERACFDGPTGVLTLRGFEDQCRRHLRLAARAGKPLSLVVADVDGFSALERVMGSDVAAEAVEQVARALEGTMGPFHFLARLGPQEFAALLPDADALQGGDHAEAMRRAVARLCIPGPEPDTRLTVSLGVAGLVPGRDTRLTDLLAAARRSLFRAKSEGRDRVGLGDVRG